MSALFVPAVKTRQKARVALAGPPGSGKTWIALAWAERLAAGVDGRGDGRAQVGVVDTERRSAGLYAKHFVFDTFAFDPPFTVARLVEVMSAAEAEGYAVVVIDSLSQFWDGEGGVLDTVDDATARARGNSSAGWKQATPLQRRLVDAITGVDAHVIVTLRTRLEYVMVEYTDGDGYRRYRPERIGMAPIQRPGIEYEFQLVGDLDLQHRLTISKSRCEALADTIIDPDRVTDAAQVLLEWLEDGDAPPPLANRDEVQRFFSCVKNAPAVVRDEMNAWWTAR